MKYGETLRQRSGNSPNNIDYDEIKRFIKKRTTAGKGESISVPGRGDDKLAAFEAELSHIFAEQHERIGLFVKSKVGEIKCRLEHAKKQLRQLFSRRPTTADRPISIARLERYSKLESDVVMIGDEVRALARFTSTNRTAFRKLLKKARKWTQAEQLCARFQRETLDGPKTFTKVDFVPLLDDYSDTLSNIRRLYENRVKHVTSSAPPTSDAIPQRLQAALKTGAKVDFDTAITTIPLGDCGELASYFVHTESVIELQVLLLQHLQYYAPRSRHNSLARTKSGEQRFDEESSRAEQDYCMLVADDPERLAKDEGAVTVSEREHSAGVIPQRARYVMRWTSDEDAVVAARTDSAGVETAPLKSKHVDTFFDGASLHGRKSEVAFADQSPAAIRDQLSSDTAVHPLYRVSTGRHRFRTVNDSFKAVVLASLDNHITITRGSKDADAGTSDCFPFAVLHVRREGKEAGELLRILDHSHLVERVRGFSLHYHALWQTHKPKDVSPPFWLPILSRDIRKLPPPSESRKDSLVARGSGSASANQQSTGQSSVRGLTDETTAVETLQPSPGAVADQLETPPLKAFRKKRRRRYAEQGDAPTHGEQRYWNEYDDPEFGEDDNAYVIYIDPDERSTLDKIFETIGSLFSPRRQLEPDADASGPGSPKDDDSSSGDEEEALSPRQASYGTLYPAGTAPSRSAGRHRRDMRISLPQATSICLAASVAILIMTFILATTSKRKYVGTVDSAVLFGMACSLIFAGLGFVALMGQRTPKSWGSVGVAAAVLLLDAICAGGLLAWVLG